MEFSLESVATQMEALQSPIARDLKLNLKRLLTESTLDAREAALALLATSTSAGAHDLIGLAREQLGRLDVPPEQVQEAAESAALMGMLNMYYRFRHFIGHSPEAQADVNYAQAGLRMTALAKPMLGKDRFEMLAFAVSVINGCEMCVISHEKALREHGVSPAKIHDLAKLAAVVKGWSALVPLT